MIPVYNTIPAKKNITLLEIEVHYRMDGKEYRIVRLFNSPVKLGSGDTAIIAWNIAITD